MNLSPVRWIRRWMSAICCEKEAFWEPIWREVLVSLNSYMSPVNFDRWTPGPEIWIKPSLLGYPFLNRRYWESTNRNEREIGRASRRRRERWSGGRECRYRCRCHFFLFLYSFFLACVRILGLFLPFLFLVYGVCRLLLLVNLYEQVREEVSCLYSFGLHVRTPHY